MGNNLILNPNFLIKKTKNSPTSINISGILFYEESFWVGTNLIFWLFEVMIFSELGNIAWEAHIGGFIFGFLVGRTFDGRGLPNAPMPPGH